MFITTVHIQDFFPSQTETLSPLNTDSLFPSPQLMVTPFLLSVSMDLTTWRYLI